MVQTRQEWQWDIFIPTLIQQLQGPQTIAPAEIYANLYTLLYLEKNGVSQDKMWNNLTTGGHLFHQIHLTSNDAKATALCLIPILLSTPNNSLRQHIGNSQRGFERFHNIIKHPDSHEKIISYFAENIVKFSTIEKHLELLGDASHTSKFIYAAMEVIAENGPLAKMLTEYAFNVDTSHIYSIALKRIDKNYEQEFVEFLIDGFKDIDKKVWSLELKDSGYTLQLLIDIVDKKYQPKLNIDFQDALINHAEDLIKNNVELQHSKDEWDNVYNALASHTKNTFLKHLLDMVIRSKDNTDKILDIYGELLVDCVILSNDADDLVRVGFKNFIEKVSDVELTWMNTVISRRKMAYGYQQH